MLPEFFILRASKKHAILYLTENHESEFREKRGESGHTKKQIVPSPSPVAYPDPGACFLPFFLFFFLCRYPQPPPAKNSTEPSISTQSSILTAGEASIVSTDWGCQCVALHKIGPRNEYAS